MSRKIFRSVLTRGLLITSFVSLLFSFAPIKGGDIFEVYLNDKRIIQQYVHVDPDGVKTFTLDKAAAGDKLRVMYSHCGQVGKSRTISITNEEKKVLKTWKYADAPKAGKIMACDARDVLALVKENGRGKLNLVYSSAEIPEGKLLATMIVNNTSTEIGKTK